MGKRRMDSTTWKRFILFEIASIIAIIVFAVAVLFIIPSAYETLCKNRVYSDLEEKLDHSLLSSNITIMMLEETEIDYGTSASLAYAGTGVIFDSDEQYYYVLTAAHVVDSGDQSDTLSEDGDETKTIYTDYYVLSSDEPSLGEANRASETPISVEEYCAWFPALEIEYISENSDIAILRFSSDKEFTPLSLASADSECGDRIVVIGQNKPALEHYYGKVISKDLEMFETDDGRSDQVLYSNAYSIPGFSGGAVLNEDMELTGISIGAGTDFRGRFRYGAFIPASTVTEEIESWKAQ